jgi:hypothetical protein
MSRMSTTTRPPRRHHYLPQMYQRAFANGTGQVRVLNLRNRRDFTTNPVNAFVETDYYTVASVDAEVDHELIERRIYADVESHTTPILRALVNGEFPPSPQHRADFAAFMALMVTRGPHFRAQSDDFADQWGKVIQLQAAMTPNEYWERQRREWEDAGRFGAEPPGPFTPEQQRKLARGELFNTRATKQHAIEMSFSVFEDLAVIFQAMDWAMVSFAEPCLFSGALPVTYWRRTDRDSLVGLAPATADEILMPLSPSRALALTHWPEGTEPGTIGERDRRIAGTKLIAGHLNGVMARWNEELLLCPDVRHHPRPTSLGAAELGVIATDG